jgi:hypothetical protein
MKPMSLTDVKLVERFLKEQRFRHAQTPKIYGAILCGFQSFASKHNPVEPLGISLLQLWLKAGVYTFFQAAAASVTPS